MLLSMVMFGVHLKFPESLGMTFCDRNLTPSWFLAFQKSLHDDHHLVTHNSDELALVVVVCQVPLDFIYSSRI